MLLKWRWYEWQIREIMLENMRAYVGEPRSSSKLLVSKFVSTRNTPNQEIKASHYKKIWNLPWNVGSFAFWSGTNQDFFPMK